MNSSIIRTTPSHIHTGATGSGGTAHLVSVADLLAHIHAHIHVHAHTYTSTHIHTHTHTYIHSYIHKHTDTHRQTDRHTHTHTQERQEAGGSAHLVSTAGAERTTKIAVLLAAALYAAWAARHRGLCWLENKFYSEVATEYILFRGLCWLENTCITITI